MHPINRRPDRQDKKEQREGKKDGNLPSWAFASRQVCLQERCQTKQYIRCSVWQPGELVRGMLVRT
jgi:hypothetical protein